MNNSITLWHQVRATFRVRVRISLTIPVQTIKKKNLQVERRHAGDLANKVLAAIGRGNLGRGIGCGIGLESGLKLWLG